MDADYDTLISEKKRTGLFFDSETGGMTVFNTVARVCELAKERDMTLYQFCRACDIPYSTVSATRRRNGQLTIDTIEYICCAAGISFAEFFNAEPGGHE